MIVFNYTSCKTGDGVLGLCSDSTTFLAENDIFTGTRGIIYLVVVTKRNGLSFTAR